MKNEGYFEELLVNMFAGVLLYAAGFITSRLWGIIRRRANEEKLKNNVKVALDIIYDTEKIIKGKKRGAEKLEFATREYMQRTKIKDYDRAQKQILNVFNLTKLSK